MTLIKSISGIRGTIGGETGNALTPIDIVKFTAAYATELRRRLPGKGSYKVVVGRDARISGKMVESIVCGTLLACGIDVVNAGMASTPTTEMAVIFEKPHLPETAEVWQSIIFLSIFCTGIAFIVQAVAQQYTTASHVGIIFTLEPVFAGIVAFFLAGEVLTVKAYIGAALMIGALFITEIDFSGIKKLKGSDK